MSIYRRERQHARTGDPGAPEGTADARVPALPRALRPARRPLEGLVRLPVSDAAAPRARRRRRTGAGDAGRGNPEAPRLPHHRRRRAAVPPAPGGASVGHPSGGHPVPDPARLLPVPPPGDPRAAPRPQARGPGGAPRRHQGDDRGRRRHGRRLPPSAHGARARGDRGRHRVADRSDPAGAEPVRHHRARRAAAPGIRDASQEGAHHMNEVRIAIVGLGNCASSLIQGLEYYKDADPSERVPGLMHVELGGYHIRDVRVVAAFDVDAKKVGKDVAEAIFTEPNNTIRFSDVPPTGVTVLRGRTLDGLGIYYRDTIVESDEPEADVVSVLRESGADVLISYLPVGSDQADRFYAECALDRKSVV